MQRREFITLLGGAAAWPITARAQQPAMPVVGFLSSRALGNSPQLLTAFRQGLKETGFVEGQNVAIEYRFADNRYERLPALAADLVHRQVAVIAASPTAAALAAKAATTTIPIVFEAGADPVQARPRRQPEQAWRQRHRCDQYRALKMAPKRLELLHELSSGCDRHGACLSIRRRPRSPTSNCAACQAAAQKLGIDLHVLDASTERDFDAVFANLVASACRRARGRRWRVPGRAPRAACRACGSPRHACGRSNTREFVAAGGLASYGGDIKDAYRLAGAYAARILKGEMPVDLPVQQSTKVELILNLKAAKALGISVPQSAQSRADEIIE